ncbi:MarR family transcriptional regulator [Clostridium kluyveri]|uniref:MarR family transcriptional regulator n=1 Tax=Clostridium kluyveri TaxID=1534 RepID=UPI00224546E4|nr:MarR family transcriptional regulator [Clostridium kluyveri]UZQ49190.1 MarR family transcriptional regulator [Clostridium kluyveri]
MIEEDIAIIANYFWKKSIDNINRILSDGQIKNFNMNDYYYLTVIYQLETPNFGDVANALHLTKPSISAMVQRLMKNGLVSKIQSEEDKRIFHLELTEKGTQIIQGDYELYHSLANDILKYLTEKQKSDISCLLNMVVGNLKKQQSEDGKDKMS